MGQLTVPNAPKEYATQYHELLGVDYQADQTEVDRRRSPEMINMISDFGGNPIKRDGYRRVGISYSALLMIDGVMYGVYATNVLLAVAKIKLDGYEFTEIGHEYLNLAVGKVKHAFAYKDYIYVIATKCMVCFNTTTSEFKYVGIGANMMSTNAVGESAPVLSDNIPTTVISLKPDGTGGVALDDKNLFSIYQKVQYRGDGTSTEYTIPTYKKMGTYVVAEVKDSNGDWQPASVSVGSSSSQTGKSLDGESTMTSNVVDAKVTFTTASRPVSLQSLRLILDERLIAYFSLR